MNLRQGAISSAILQAAGQSLQKAVLKAAKVSLLLPGSVVITDGFNLKCQKVFHTVCPMWTSASDEAEKVSFCCFSLLMFWFSAPLTCDRSLLDFKVYHHPMSGGGRETEAEVTVLPRHRDGCPEVPQRGGFQSPAEGSPQPQPHKNTSPPSGGVHGGSSQ